MESYLGGWTLGLPSWLISHDYVRPVQVNASSALAADQWDQWDAWT